MNIRKATNKDIEVLIKLRIDFIKTAFCIDSLSCHNGEACKPII